MSWAPEQITVLEISHADDAKDDGTGITARLALSLHVENPTEVTEAPIDFNVECADTDESGG